MKTLVFILVFVLMASAPAYSADWHLDALDKFQTVRRIYEAKERDLLCQREPKLQDYYKLWDSLLEVSRRMDRRALVLKLEALPPDGGIVWDNPWEWGCPIESSEEEASLATKDGAFATLRTEKNRLRNDLKLLHDLMKLRQSVYEKLKVENVVNSQAMIEELTRIQKRIQANNNLSITFRMTKKGDLFLDIENKSDKEQVFKSNIIGVLDLKVFDFPTRGYLQFRTDKADILFLGNHEVPDWRSAGNYSSQPFPPAEGLKQIINPAIKY